MPARSCAPRALRPRAAIEKTLLAVGSHDVAIDLLAGALARRGLELVSANVGSIAGLVALRDGATHLAGTHVLDARTLRYNDAAVARFGPRERVALVHFAEREQGLIVAPGNPLGLRDLAAVARSGARFVNRQRDAGTRILLDAMLQRAAIEPDALAGYERIEFTHLAVAALVADGTADCGMGIRAAAVALGCDFVPLGYGAVRIGGPRERARKRRPAADARRRAAVERVARGGRCVARVRCGAQRQRARSGRRRSTGVIEVELFGMARALAGEPVVRLALAEPLTAAELADGARPRISELARGRRRRPGFHRAAPPAARRAPRTRRGRTFLRCRPALRAAARERRMKGYAGPRDVLEVDLTAQSWRRYALDDETFARVLGGVGLAVELVDGVLAREDGPSRSARPRKSARVRGRPVRLDAGPGGQQTRRRVLIAVDGTLEQGA